MINARYSKPYKHSKVHASIDVSSSNRLGGIKLMDQKELNKRASVTSLPRSKKDRTKIDFEPYESRHDTIDNSGMHLP